MKKVFLVAGFVSFISIVLFVFVLPAFAEDTSEPSAAANQGAGGALSSSAAERGPLFRRR